MIIRLLLFSTAEFAVYVFGALVFFAAGLLFWDAWRLNKAKPLPALRSFGFFLLAAIYMVYASSVESPSVLFIAQVAKLVALAMLLISVLREPILGKPRVVPVSVIMPVALLSYFTQLLIPLSAVMFLFTGIWYWRRGTEGLDKQLKPLAIAFIFLSIAEYIKTGFSWSGTTNVFWSQMLMEHSLVWNIHLAMQAAGIVILGAWVWGYIRFRLQIQLFVTMLTSILVIFLSTTVFFSFMLLRNIEKDQLRHLETDAKVFQYALDRLQLESLAHASNISTRNTIRESLISKDADTLYRVTSELLASLNLSSLISLSPSGEVLVRAENRESSGDSMAQNPFIAKAMGGQPIGAMIRDDQPMRPSIAIASAVPVYESGGTSIIGSLFTRLIVDDAFVDGIKQTTGLDATIFAGDKRAATTIVGPDGVSRFIGTTESNPKIKKMVLEEGKIFTGAADVLHEPYYAAYTPLRTYGGEIIGMLFIGRPQAELLAVAQQSLTMTFVGSIALMMLALYPVFLISRYMQENIEV